MPAVGDCKIVSIDNVDEIQKSFTEAELNKLIAVHELPVMKKYSKNSVSPHLKSFVKSRLKKDDPRFVEIKALLKKRYKEKNVKPDAMEGGRSFSQCGFLLLK